MAASENAIAFFISFIINQLKFEAFFSMEKCDRTQPMECEMPDYC